MTAAKRIARWLGRALLLLAATALAAELVLQVGSLLVRDRSHTPTGGAHYKIIGVGDSHMFGAMVSEEESFPAQLRTALNEGFPNEFEVINLGVPGMGTTQVRNRFVANLSLYQPDIAIIWCGINNRWNRSEVDSKDAANSTLEAYALRLRLYRLYRVWRHNQEIDQGILQQPPDKRDDAATYVGEQAWAIRHSGREEVLDVERFETEPEPAQVRSHAYRDFLEMAQWGNAAGVAVVFIGYPLEWNHFAEINLAMQEVATATGATYLATRPSFELFEGEDAKLLRAAHPTAAMYRAFAVAAAPTIRHLVE